MIEYIQNIVEEFDFNNVNQGETATDKIVNTLSIDNVTVDLGLPSGTLWCKYNLGCDYKLLNEQPKYAQSSEWFGDFYAWGDPEIKTPYNAENENAGCIEGIYKGYSEKTYKFGEKFKKYNNKDNLIQLLPEDDVAYQKMHFYNYKFHTPTKELFEELLANTTQEWCFEYDRIPGVIFHGKNGNELFFPMTGYLFGSWCEGNGKKCCLWLSDRATDNINDAWDVYFNFNKEITIEKIDRWRGLTVRPVINL